MEPLGPEQVAYSLEGAGVVIYQKDIALVHTRSHLTGLPVCLNRQPSLGQFLRFLGRACAPW